MEALARTGEAIDRDSGGFFARGIGADGFAKLLGGGGGVENVVSDLEGFADGGGVGGDGGEVGGGGAGGQHAHAAGADDQVAGFVLLDVAQAVGIGREAFALDVFHLPANHAGGAGGSGKFADNVHGGDGCARGEFEGEAWGIASEEEAMAWPYTMAGGLAAARVVVVHAGRRG